jgi:hypothetical protein
MSTVYIIICALAGLAAYVLLKVRGIYEANKVRGLSFYSIWPRVAKSSFLF